MVQNHGPDGATGVVVKDQLPAGLAYVSSTPSQGTYSSATGNWDVGALANGSSATLQLHVTVTASGAIVNTAQVVAADQFDPNSAPANNNANENDQSLAAISASPTAISLVSFTAALQGQTIVIRWTTADEINTWGFYLYRSADTRREHAIRVTPQPILGRGRGQGASYEWLDTIAESGTRYSYWLQEVEVSGATNEYGPAKLLSGPSQSYGQIFVPLATR